MIIIKGERGSGKTAKLIELVDRESGHKIIVCDNVEKMAARCLERGIRDIDFITYEDYTSQALYSNVKYYIDDLDQLFEIMHIEGYTLED